MDIKLSSPSISSSSSGKQQFDFCDDDLSEHGYGSLEDLNCPSNASSMIQSCDVSPSSLSSSSSSSSLPTAITTTTLTSSSPSSLSSSLSSESSSSLSSSGSIDSIACLNNSLKSTESSLVRKDHSKPSQQPKANHPQNSNIVLENSLDSCSKESNNNDIHFQDTSSGELQNDQKLNDGKVHSPLPQMLQSGNRFKFVPKNRQSNEGKCKGTSPTHNGRNNSNGRGSRKGDNRDQENRKRSQMRHKNNDDVVFIIRKVDRSLRRTVSESSGETLPVRGILKYPRGWNRRTLSESNCDNSEQSNLMDSHENGQTQSLECISPLDEVSTCEASTESASSLIGESHEDQHNEEKPKKSVHFNCYVSKATFNINSTILNNNNNKHAGSNNNPNKKKNRRQNNNYNNNIPPSTYNHKINIKDRKNTSTNPTKPNSSHKDNHPIQQSNDNLRSHKSQTVDHRVPSNSQPKNESNGYKPLTTDKQLVNCDSIVIDSVVIMSGDKLDHIENIDPMEGKLRSRQDSGYDSETSDKRNSIEDSGTTCVKSPNRQFTVQKVDLN